LFSGYSLTATAFNTGFFAFNTAIIDSTTQPRLKLILDKYMEFSRFGEQLCMNLFFYKNWEQLPMEYNLFATYLTDQQRLSRHLVDGVVLHFPRFGDETNCRCWNKENVFFDEWNSNLQRAELIDLNRIPKPGNRWPASKHLFYKKWKLRAALFGNYVGFCRNKLSARQRAKKFFLDFKRGLLKRKILE